MVRKAITMVSLLPGNEVAYMPPLKEWPPSDSTPRPVGGASGPPGTPDDTWESVAQQYSMDVRRLIYFNFKTNNPQQVNFYLRTYVGCNTPSPTRWNWTFRRAMPGIIYLPVITMDFSPDDQRLGPGVIDVKPDVPDFSFKDPEWAEKFNKWLGKILPEVERVVKGTLWLANVTVGAPTQAYIRDNCEKEYFSGISLGIVLGADKREEGFILGRGFKNHFHSHDTDPKINDLYQLAYAIGLATGLNYADKMNEAQRSRLRNAVRSHMDLSRYPDFYDRDAWRKGTFLRNYYIVAAGFFRQFLLPYWLNGSLQFYLQTKHP
jgi:hypothetical protein